MESIPAVAGWNPTRHKAAVQSVGFRLGVWSNEEVDLLKKNVEQYCKDNHIKDPADIIFQCRKEERKDFYRKASLGINRPVQSVYRRLLRMYDKTNNLGKYSEEEVEKLKALKEAHGKNWQVISKKLGRSASSVKDKCRNLETLISGKWTDEEEKALANAVHMLTNSEPGSNVCVGIDWQQVAQHVKTRNEFQCRAKWVMHLNWKNFGGRSWTHLDDKLLVAKLAELKPNNENEVDWVELAKGWDAARSAQWLRSKWRMLKYDYKTGRHMKIAEFCQYLLNKPEFMQKRTTKLLDDMSLGNIETILMSSEDEFDNLTTITAGSPLSLTLLPEYTPEITLLESNDVTHVVSNDVMSNDVTHVIGDDVTHVLSADDTHVIPSDECDSGSYREYLILDEPAIEVIIDGTESKDDSDSRLSEIYSEHYVPDSTGYSSNGSSEKRFNQMVTNDVPLSEMTIIDDDRDVVQFNSPLHCLANAAADHEILLDDEIIFGQCLMNGEDHV